MQLDEYKRLWTGLENNIERNWQLDLDVLKKLNLGKTRNKIRHLFRVKFIALCFFLVVTSHLLLLIIEDELPPTTIITLSFYTLWTALVSVFLIYELFLLQRVNYTEPLVTLLKRLVLIKLSTIRLLRLGALILPVNTAFLGYYFVFGRNLLEDLLNHGINWLIGVTFASCLLISIWLYKKFNAKNAGKPWMYQLLRGNGSQIMDAIHYVKEVQSFEKDV